MNKIEEAILYATDAHAGANRDSTKIPYILHPLEAAAIAAGLTDNPDVITAAVLHDVVEDTERSAAEIAERFGENVARLVGSDTENKRPELPSEATWKLRKQETLDAIPTLADDELMVVFSDKLANLRSIWNDYQLCWEKLWERFSQKDPKEQLWYYRGIFDACGRLDWSPLYREYGWRIEEIAARIREYEEFGRHETNSLDVLATPKDRVWVFRMPGSEQVLVMDEKEFQAFCDELEKG